MDMFDLASTLFGGRGNPVAQGSTLTATGSAASEDGTAYLVMNADVTPAEGVDGDTDQTIIDVPTSPSVAAGDDVIVTLVGDGPLKTPIVMANPGSGDRQQSQITSAATLAAAAQAVANAINQHFWHDGNGAHVTEVTQEEWEDAGDPNYHSGPNSLWNSAGMLFRDGLTNLLALVAGLNPGVVIYDGQGNNADNVTASFDASGVRIGGKVPVNDSDGASVEFFDADEDNGSDLSAFVVHEYTPDPDDPGQRIEREVVLNSRVTDDGEGVDTDSHAYTTLRLLKQLWYGITDPNEQYTHAESVLEATAQYGVDTPNETTSEAIVRASATTIDDSGQSYVELLADALGVGEGEGLINYVAMPQVLAALQQPFTTQYPISGTWTASGTGWHASGFGYAATTGGAIDTYINRAGIGAGYVTARMNVILEVSLAHQWKDSVAGQRGTGVFVGSTTPGSGTEYSTQCYFTNYNGWKRVDFAPMVIKLASGQSMAFGRYEPTNAVYDSGYGSWLTIRVLGIY